MIDRLLEVIDRLLAPDGCPWDREQTLRSWAHMVFEEICEVMDSLTEADSDQLADELGDVITGIFFLVKAAASEKGFSPSRPFELAAEKLRRRHPHIFADGALPMDPKAIEKQWDEIKTTEVHHKHRTSRFDGISKSLPALAIMQKLAHKANKVPGCEGILDELSTRAAAPREEEIAKEITRIILEAEREGIQVEHALRHYFGLCRAALMERERKAKGA